MTAAAGYETECVNCLRRVGVRSGRMVDILEAATISLVVATVVYVIATIYLARFTKDLARFTMALNRTTERLAEGEERRERVDARNRQIERLKRKIRRAEQIIAWKPMGWRGLTNLPHEEFEGLSELAQMLTYGKDQAPKSTIDLLLLAFDIAAQGVTIKNQLADDFVDNVGRIQQHLRDDLPRWRTRVVELFAEDAQELRDSSRQAS